MDIRPVKKRRQKIVSRSRQAADGSKLNNQQNITIKSKPSPLGPLSKEIKSNRSKVKDFFKKRFFLILIFIFLGAVYLPASKYINTGEQYQDLINQSFPLSTILNEVSYMPQKLFLMLTESNGLSSILLLKIYSFIFIVFVVYLFYQTCLNWLGKNVALITTFLFSSSTWMILSSQSLSFNNIYLAFIPLVIYLNNLLRQDKNILGVFMATLLFSITLYSPGMVWPILGFIALLPLFMQKILAKYNLRNIWVLLIFTLVVILPLFVTMVLRPDNFSYILVGDSQTTIYALVQNLQTSLDAMFLNGIPDSNLWLVGTPVFSYLTSLLFIFGLVFLFVNKRFRQHFNFLIVSLVFALLTVAFVGLSALSLIIPIIYLVVGFGVGFILSQWYALFPSNPVARNLGLALVIFIALLSSGYNITRYYIAQPKANNLISSIGSEKIT